MWNSEIDPYACAVLKKHWPDVPNLGDITKIDWRTVERPDLICGGFPCQDISQAGKGAGIKEGTRSGLWFEFHKAIRVLRPKYALVENVSALSFRGLLTVLGDFAQTGYNAEWFTLRASDVGAPHRRERLFIVATPARETNLENADCERTNNDEGRTTRQYEPVLAYADDGRGENDEVQTGRYAVRFSRANLANPEDIGRQRSGNARRGRNGLENGSQDVANASSKQLLYETNEYELERKRTRELQFRESRNNTAGWWAVEPDVGRVANGVPSRVDRLKCLGNAVVPQVAQVIGEAIIEHENYAKVSTQLLKTTELY